MKVVSFRLYWLAILLPSLLEVSRQISNLSVINVSNGTCTSRQISVHSDQLNQTKGAALTNVDMRLGTLESSSHSSGRHPVVREDILHWVDGGRPLGGVLAGP